ncbi:unnamed protein product [Enterobius vermicularis]|uniref:Phosphatase tensin-type domain-containing protein n=1 Tax=Enterobius vermicularis TaxID=51028 RepID=A0A158Q991_ENTVE|nr:unnamed protein product [Enterobius vermicularis]
MELEYVTGRIIVVLFPDVITDVQYRAGFKEMTSTLRKNYPECYKILNVSKKRNDLARIHPVEEFGWPEELAPPLDRLCTVCKMIETWLAASARNVVVIHCKGGHSRAAIVISAYKQYISICGHDDSSPDCFAMQRFSQRFLGPEGQPSHKRYIKYFAALLSGTQKISAATVYLNQILLTNFSGRNVLFKIYEGMQPTQSTQIVHAQNQTVIDLFGLPLRGDILIKCFERTKTSERAPLFRCQFNTCTFDLGNCQENLFSLKFAKEELDDIFKG